MSGPSGRSACAPTADRLPELALGILSGTERADVLAHLNQCASCREISTAWAATVDVLPTLLGESEPPAGFENRTVERLQADRGRVPRRPIVQRMLAVAAIVAVAMVVTLAAVRIIDARSSPADEREPDISSARMVGPSGHRAGAAFVTTGTDQYMFLDLDYGGRSGRYRIEAVDDVERVTEVGHVEVTDGHGTWAGEMPDDTSAGAPAMVRVVAPDGEVFCQARFGPIAT